MKVHDSFESDRSWMHEFRTIKKRKFPTELKPYTLGFLTI